MSALPARAPDRWLRPAVSADIPDMAALINRYAAEGLMLPKTPEALSRSLRDYVVVADLGGNVRACGGLRVYSERTAEIVGLAVAPRWRGGGLGGRVVDHLVERARTFGIPRVFAMTLSVPFFARHGFLPVSRATLPEKERADCAGCAWRDACREQAVHRLLVEEGVGRGRVPSRSRPRVRSRRARLRRSGRSRARA